MTEAVVESRPASPWTAAVMLVLLLAVGGPLFVRTPLSNDPVYYDIQARNLLSGGVLYRDFFEPNLPGVVWVQAAVQAVCGESRVALRLFDLSVFGLVVAFAALWLKNLGWNPAQQLWLAAGCLFFYFSQSQWCHCQRDGWLLLPALAALTLRARQMERLTGSAQAGSSHDGGRVFAWGLLEGIVWGLGVWLKPHIVVPAALVWLTGTLTVRQWRRSIMDFVALTCGGLIAGAAGVAWMAWSGCWPAFLDTMLHWNPEYLASSRTHWSLMRLANLAWFTWPWILLHLPAIVIATRQLRQAAFASRETQDLSQIDLRKPLLAALYIGWTVQAFLLQHLFHYVHTPAILLALLVVAQSLPVVSRHTGVRRWVHAFTALAMLSSPLLRQERLGCWWECVTSQPSPATEDRLAVLQEPRWQDLEKIAAYLERQQVREGDVCCYNSELVSLYRRLRLTPPTRFVYARELLATLPSRREQILAELQGSSALFLVTDLRLNGLTREQQDQIQPHSRRSPTNAEPLPFPWNRPIVFRSGPYLVHRSVSRMTRISQAERLQPLGSLGD